MTVPTTIVTSAVTESASITRRRLLGSILPALAIAAAARSLGGEADAASRKPGNAKRDENVPSRKKRRSSGRRPGRTETPPVSPAPDPTPAPGPIPAPDPVLPPSITAVYRPVGLDLAVLAVNLPADAEVTIDIYGQWNDLLGIYGHEQHETETTGPDGVLHRSFMMNVPCGFGDAAWWDFTIRIHNCGGLDVTAPIGLDLWAGW